MGDDKRQRYRGNRRRYFGDRRGRYLGTKTSYRGIEGQVQGTRGSRGRTGIVGTWNRRIEVQGESRRK